MQAFYQLFDEAGGADGRPCRTVLVGAPGASPCWQVAADMLRLPLLHAPTIEEASLALAGDAPTVVVAPLSLFLDGASKETAGQWLSAAAAIVITDNEADAVLWRQLAWDALVQPQSVDTAVATLARAVAEANRRAQQLHLIAIYAHRLASLTADERDVLEAVCEGRLNKQIARDLQVSVRTVEQRRRHVFEKMGVDSAVPLAALTAVVQTLSEQTVERPPTPIATPIILPMPQSGLPMAMTTVVFASLALGGLN